MQRENPAKRLQFLFGLAVVWLFVAGFLILQLWPDLPKTDLGWFLLVVVGPPVYVAGEGFFGWLFSESHGKEISNKQFSWLRVTLAFAVVVVLLGLSVLVSSILKQ
jgi:hypothetical protein